MAVHMFWAEMPVRGDKYKMDGITFRKLEYYGLFYQYLNNA